MAATAGTRLYLEMPVQFLKGVGERRADLLKRLNIRVAGDLLYHVPHRYDDASTITPIASVDVGQEVTVIGRVVSKGILPTRKGLRIFQAVLRDFLDAELHVAPGRDGVGVDVVAEHPGLHASMPRGSLILPVTAEAATV